MSEIELDYGAISIDTCIFDRYGIGLEKGVLRQLDQFKDSPVKIIFSEVVDSEICRHLTEKIGDARSKMLKGLKATKNQFLVSQSVIDEIQCKLLGDEENLDIARKRIDHFYESIGSEVVAAKGLERLLELYFKVIPPFEKSGKKKHEFPDAIALLSLEWWAKENKTKILVVSSDKGWKQFSEKSEFIDVYEKLPTALAHFLPHTEVRKIIDHITKDFVLGNKNHILDALAKAISKSLDSADIEVDAHSSYYFEEGDVSAKYLDHELLPGNNDPLLTIIKLESKMIVLLVTATVACEVNASFDLSFRDPIDKDYICLGNHSYKVQEGYLTDILITLSGDFSSGLEKIDVAKIEVLEPLEYVDFGEISVNMEPEEGTA